MDVAGHDRGAGGHRLEQDDAERLAAGRRGDVHVGRPEELGLLLVRDPAQELHARHPAREDVAARLSFLGPRPDDEEPAVAAGLAQDPVRLEQVEQALPRLVAADEQDVARAVLPAGDGHGVAEAGDIHAVRDDLVVAREEPVDEVACRGADGDPAVEAVGVAAHRPAAELVGRRPAAEGVERGDVHAVRRAQHDRRQERDERLVEVEEVEPLALQHVADLRQVARRERDRPDRAVGRHAEALAQADDVTLAGALEAVARRDDPDVVAPGAQPGVEVADVLVHAARQRIDVRRDEADLHGSTCPSRMTAAAIPVVTAVTAVSPGS